MGGLFTPYCTRFESVIDLKDSLMKGSGIDVVIFCLLALMKQDFQALRSLHIYHYPVLRLVVL